jgi:hypothetical protein
MHGVFFKPIRISSWKPEVTNSNGKYLEDRLTELETENSRLQRLVVELLFKNQQLRDTRLSQSDDGRFDRTRNLPISD